MSAHTTDPIRPLRVRFLPVPIDPPAWARADWLGLAFSLDAAGRVPPALGLAFRHPGQGRRIFRAWRARFGPVGADAALRVAIIEGPAPGRSTGYFVHLGAHPDWTGQDTAGLPASEELGESLSGYVVHRATPPVGTDHLTAFKAELARHGRYSLIPVLWGGCRFEPIHDLSVRMTRVHFRTTAEIGANDIDRVCFDREHAGLATDARPVIRCDDLIRA